MVNPWKPQEAQSSSLGYKKEPYWASQVALVVKNPPANTGDVGDMGSIPGSGRSPGGGHGNPLQYSCLENPMDKGAWWATVYSKESTCNAGDPSWIPGSGRSTGEGIGYSLQHSWASLVAQLVKYIGNQLWWVSWDKHERGKKRREPFGEELEIQICFWVKGSFSEEVICEQWIEVYKNVVGVGTHRGHTTQKDTGDRVSHNIETEKVWHEYIWKGEDQETKLRRKWGQTLGSLCLLLERIFIALWAFKSHWGAVSSKEL